MMRGRDRCLPLCWCGSVTSYVVLDFEAKDGIKSTNSKPTLLEDQKKERENIVMDEREAFYHATLIVKAFDFIVAALLSLTIMLALTVVTAMQIHSRHERSSHYEVKGFHDQCQICTLRTVNCAVCRLSGQSMDRRAKCGSTLRAKQSMDCANPCFVPNIYI